MQLGKNKRANFDYEVLEEYVAGLVLTGPEVRSCRNGQINLLGSYIVHQDGKWVLRGAKIARFDHDQSSHYDPERPRVILLNAREIAKIQIAQKNAGLTIIPLEVFTQGRLIKLRIGVARGRKNYDQRALIKERDIKRRVRETGEF
ncbi:MAG TPA: SsrA-binding protein SmpB [Candidatus Gracilibacteria bacterium]|nr:SsrA-binding protein SmpB [Candidatus Gracilibacteria bacterium]